MLLNPAINSIAAPHGAFLREMNSFIALAIASLPMLAHAAGTPVTLVCPEKITTRQSLHEPLQGWRASQERPFSSAQSNAVPHSEHNFAFVNFSEGVPEDRVILAPDRETPQVKGRWTSTWSLQNSADIWFSCQYQGTTVMLSRQLPAGLKQCLVKYHRNRGLVAIEQVACQ